jgi:glycosyltransferase involved in cell wall biosynthesis
MKILFTTFVYNELPYISDVIKYYKKEGLDIFIIDNCSNDGTYEWLVQNNIHCTRFDTNESFHLTVLQEELTRQLKKIKPDWIVYGGADLYYVFDKPIKETIESIDELGYNQITVGCYGAYNTGEKFKTPLYKTYFYGKFYKDLEMISKFDKDLQMNGDNIIIPNIEKIKIPGIMVNYGACKPKSEQKTKLKRRQKAWDEGLSKNTGKHFKSGSLVNWTWKKEDWLNFHRCDDMAYFKKLYSEN